MQALKVGIEPVSNVKESIIKIRQEVADKSGTPSNNAISPHITCLINSFENYEDVDSYLGWIADRFYSFPITINGIKYFHLKAADKYIVQAGVEKTDDLQRLQENIVLDTSIVKHGHLMQEIMESGIKGFKYTGREALNNERFGSPYFGENWEPSIDIAVLDKEGFDKVKDDLVKIDIEYRFPLMDIALYKFRGKWMFDKRYFIKPSRWKDLPTPLI
jgi:hypothetical protein